MIAYRLAAKDRLVLGAQRRAEKLRKWCFKKWEARRCSAWLRLFSLRSILLCLRRICNSFFFFLTGSHFLKHHFLSF